MVVCISESIHVMVCGSSHVRAVNQENRSSMNLLVISTSMYVIARHLLKKPAAKATGFLHSESLHQRIGTSAQAPYCSC